MKGRKSWGAKEGLPAKGDDLQGQVSDGMLHLESWESYNKLLKDGGQLHLMQAASGHTRYRRESRSIYWVVSVFCGQHHAAEVVLMTKPRAWMRLHEAKNQGRGRFKLK